MKLPLEIQEIIQVYVSMHRIKELLLAEEKHLSLVETEKLFDSDRIIFLLYKPFIDPKVNLNQITQGKEEQIEFSLREILHNLQDCINISKSLCGIKPREIQIQAWPFIPIRYLNDCNTCIEEIDCDVQRYMFQSVGYGSVTTSKERDIVFYVENDYIEDFEPDQSWGEFFNLIKVIIPNIGGYRFEFNE